MSTIEPRGRYVPQATAPIRPLMPRDWRDVDEIEALTRLMAAWRRTNTVEASLAAQVAARRPANPSEVRAAARQVVREYIGRNPDLVLRATVKKVFTERHGQIVAAAENVVRDAGKSLALAPPTWLPPTNR